MKFGTKLILQTPIRKFQNPRCDINLMIQRIVLWAKNSFNHWVSIDIKKVIRISNVSLEGYFCPNRQNWACTNQENTLFTLNIWNLHKKKNPIVANMLGGCRKVLISFYHASGMMLSSLSIFYYSSLGIVLRWLDLPSRTFPLLIFLKKEQEL